MGGGEIEMMIERQGRCLHLDKDCGGREREQWALVRVDSGGVGEF